jgi:hypothetical protein
MKKKILIPVLSFREMLNKKLKEGYLVGESLAYMNRNTGYANKNFCQVPKRGIAEENVNYESY